MVPLWSRRPGGCNSTLIPPLTTRLSLPAHSIIGLQRARTNKNLRFWQVMTAPVQWFPEVEAQSSGAVAERLRRRLVGAAFVVGSEVRMQAAKSD